jgi:hypothetical protein
MHCRSTNELRRDAGNEIEQLRAEISRLTTENERLTIARDYWHNATAAAIQQNKFAWHKVSEKPSEPGWYVTGAWMYEPMPDGTEHERFVLHCVDQTCVATWAKDFWLGPLPAAPNEAGK